MNIKFLQILPIRGRVIEALFEVNNKNIVIGVTKTFRAIHEINQWGEVELFLRQFGELIIRKMLAENNLSDYIFEDHNFINTNRLSMKLGEIKEKLESDIIKIEEEQNSIGFKV